MMMSRRNRGGALQFDHRAQIDYLEATLGAKSSKMYKNITNFSIAVAFFSSIKMHKSSTPSFSVVAAFFSSSAGTQLGLMIHTIRIGMVLMSNRDILEISSS